MCLVAVYGLRPRSDCHSQTTPMTDRRKTMYTFTRSSMDLQSFLDLVHSRHEQFDRILNMESPAEDSVKKRKRNEVEIRKRELETRLEDCRKKKEKLNDEVAALEQQKGNQIETKHQLLLKLKQVIRSSNALSIITVLQGLAEKNRTTARSSLNGMTPMKRDREDVGLKGKFQSPVQKSVHRPKMDDRPPLPPHLACSDPPPSLNRLPPHMKSTGKVFEKGNAMPDNKGDERNHKMSKTNSFICRTKDS